jgi:hypothetical protein
MRDEGRRTRDQVRRTRVKGRGTRNEGQGTMTREERGGKSDEKGGKIRIGKRSVWEELRSCDDWMEEARREGEAEKPEGEV